MTSENKTSQTAADPMAFLSQVSPEQRKADGLELFEFMNRVTDLPPRMWGPSMVGYGRYAYTYESGRSGEFFLTGFSPRKANLSIHILPGYEFDNMPELLDRLGPHKLGRSCLYVTRLSRIDMAVLEDIVRAGLKRMRTLYQTWDV